MNANPTSSRWRLMLMALGAAVFSFALLSNANSQPGEDKDDAPPPAAKTFVGPLEGGPPSARIGIVTEQGNFLLYLCSQDQKFNEEFSRWLKGKIGDGNTIEAASADGVKVSAVVKNGTIQGEASGKGTTMKFTAKAVAACSNAGLYRAAEEVNGDEQLAGWVVDEMDAIAGAIQAKQKKLVLPAPKQNKNNNNLVGPGGNVNAQKVASALNPGNGGKGKNPLGKIDPNTRAEILQDISARFQKSGGSPLQGAFVNLVRRANANAKGTDAQDARLLNIVKKINPKTRQKYISLWDSLPGNVRSRLLGPNSALATGKGSCDSATVGKIVASLPKQIRQPSPPEKTSVKNVQIRQLVCVDETDPEFVGSDEVFVIYTVIQGAKVFDPQKTKIYTGLDSGKTAQFTGADVTVFPPAGQQPGQGDIEIAASIFEDDSADQAEIAALLSAAADAATEILQTAGKDKAANVTKAISEFLDAVVSVFPSTQFLGSDVIVVRPNGQLVSTTGQSKSSLSVRRLNRFNNQTSRYDLTNIQVLK